MSIAGNWRIGNRQRDDAETDVRASLVCIVEGETGIARVVLDHLERAGFSVRMISTKTDEIRQVQQLHPALTIIETTVFDKRALELCRTIRKTPSLAAMPVILVAKNSSEEERILGLESGADGFITQLSSGQEFVARVRAVLRRFARQALHSGAPIPARLALHCLAGTPSAALKTGDLEIDTYAMKIRVRGREIEATALEFRLIYYLAHNQGCVFSRDQLLDAVWGTPYLEARSVDACVRRLRRKIEADPKCPSCLKTIRGAGYRLDMGEMQVPRAIAHGHSAGLANSSTSREVAATRAAGR